MLGADPVQKTMQQEATLHAVAIKMYQRCAEARIHVVSTLDDLQKAIKDPGYPEASRKVFLKKWLELSAKAAEVKTQGRLVVE